MYMCERDAETERIMGNCVAQASLEFMGVDLELEILCLSLFYA